MRYLLRIGGHQQAQQGPRNNLKGGGCLTPPRHFPRSGISSGCRKLLNPLNPYTVIGPMLVVVMVPYWWVHPHPTG